MVAWLVNCAWRRMINGMETAGFVVGLCGASVGLVAGVNTIVSKRSMSEFAASAREISVEPTWDVVETTCFWVWQERVAHWISNGHSSKSGRG